MCERTPNALSSQAKTKYSRASASSRFTSLHITVHQITKAPAMANLLFGSWEMEWHLLYIILRYHFARCQANARNDKNFAFIFHVIVVEALYLCWQTGERKYRCAEGQTKKLCVISQRLSVNRIVFAWLGRSFLGRCAFATHTQCTWPTDTHWCSAFMCK